MIKFLGKILLLIPFFYLEFLLIYNDSYPSDIFEVYYYAFLLLGFFGLLSILLNINKNLGIFYVLLSFGLYCYFYEADIFNLWPIAGLILLICDKVEIKSEKKVCQEKKKVILPNKINKNVENRSVIDDVWSRYDLRVEKSKSKLIKLKEKIKKLVGINKK